MVHKILVLLSLIGIVLNLDFERLLSSSSSDHGTDTTTALAINPHGICEGIYPHNVTDCYNQTNSTHKCCYAVFTDDNSTSCLATPFNSTFATEFFEEIEYNGDDREVNLTCQTQTNNTCGVLHPSNIYDCRLDGSDTTSCCYVEYFNHGHLNTTCMLNSVKGYNNYTIYGNHIICASCYLKSYLFILLGYFLVLLT